ncbi:BamA/TamA family outer membrane protein [Aliivibrio sp. S4TY2]|uniref:BamA/TamA family outer membrane protein n=1 Tax=unclassified Aliivibrio TaxID=2645654 RepID=UPI0023790268|nr:MULTISPECIES: BamA/TamA family outer membrane protein [unclassified Aliivibrio]MDD9155720.1 BamA/TamA family outer membrane protein [Aliivibrio sp. S4TY2]MDD9159600.1 BamA/TamA family outer membrane protein [Aliivibrio sp. S4TY1]MDD9163429.1 BamA/TamA family outer membrane protein [Aliivibrio sp. S4MY2]MDD9167429.1 BamA/TamA family outer membrane protein [Aliivibrio sp. S4MY4]MDD9186252.1 BamA/TamA family outer membrane protein [Aliivibrio sp. S4MY3]
MPFFISRLSLLTLFSIPLASSAIEFTDPIDGSLDMGEYLAENAYGFLPMPILITEPALGYGFGFAGVFLHESEKQREKRKQLAATSLNGGAQLLTPAITVAGGLATENGTWMGFIGHRRTWNKDTIRYMGGLAYGDMNMTFYRQKNNAGALEPIVGNSGVEFGMRGGGGMQQLQFRIDDSPLFLGIVQKYFQPELSINSHPNADEILNRLGNTTPTGSGVGLLMEYDTKNNFLNPMKGMNYTVEYLWFRDGIGSDYDFDTLNIKGHHYWTLTSQWSLAMRGYYKSLYTDESLLPPPAYPDIQLRGIARNRYQGEQTLSLEGQVNYQWTTRWSSNLFAGLGYASSHHNSLLKEDEQYAYGVGFRYLIARRYGMKIGIDVAFSEEDTALYFQVGMGI